MLCYLDGKMSPIDVDPVIAEFNTSCKAKAEPDTVWIVASNQDAMPGLNLQLLEKFEDFATYRV